MPRMFLFFWWAEIKLKSDSQTWVASSVLGDIEFLKLIMIFLISIDVFFMCILQIFVLLVYLWDIFWFYFGSFTVQNQHNNLLPRPNNTTSKPIQADIVAKSIECFYIHCSYLSNPIFQTFCKTSCLQNNGPLTKFQFWKVWWTSILFLHIP